MILTKYHRIQKITGKIVSFEMDEEYIMETTTIKLVMMGWVNGGGQMPLY